MIANALQLAIREIRRNVMRSFLTMLGIIIGVGAVIIMVTLGSGATIQVTEQIASLGSNLLILSPGKRMGPGQTSGASLFKQADAEAVARDVLSINAVAPVSSRSITAVFGNENWVTIVSGSTGEYFTVGNWTTKEGRLFGAREVRLGAAVCVIGETVSEKLFGDQSPIGSKIRLNKLSCEVIGLLKSKGQSSMGSDQDDLVILPLRTFHRRISGNNDVERIQISMSDGAATETVQADITRLMRSRRHLSAGEEDDFNVLDMKEIADMLSGTTQVLTGLLGAVAAVSLLVGGIGIMNIMLVSVTERTREIGIRLAIGALEREVLTQFLVEAVVVSSFGGVIGIIFAVITCVSLSGLLNVPLVFNIPIIIVAFLFSAAVGVVFGYFPARKAARMNPIEALRHE